MALFRCSSGGGTGSLPEVKDAYSDYLASKNGTTSYYVSDATQILIVQVWGRGTSGVLCAVDLWENETITNQYNDGNLAHYCTVAYSGGIITATKTQTSSTATYITFIAF